MIDVMIITFNEATNLPRCLDALAGWTNRVFVIDSGSTDGTCDLARAKGATVVSHAWEGYARQKNWGLNNLPWQAPWVLIVDADEVVTSELRHRLCDIAAKPPESVPENGFFINRLPYFLGHPIRHCGYFPSWNMRFFKRGQGLYEDRAVHEHIIIADPVGYISELILHHDQRGLEHYMAKHNRYSTLEAQVLFQERQQGNHLAPAANLAAGTRLRRWLKRRVMPHLPLPGATRFFYMYLLKAGLLDGRAGLEFCRFISMYDSLVVLKLRELNRLAAQGHTEDLATAAGLVVPEGQMSGAAPGPRKQAQPVEKQVAPSALTAPAPVSSGRSVEAEPRHPDADGWAARLEPGRLPPGNWPAAGSVPVSVLIPVKNEQAILQDCIRHVLWANEIVVVDSQSSDATVAIAQAMGASVYQFRLSAEGWPKKKNWALQNVPWKNPWVLIMDADEHMTPELTAEVASVVRGQHRPTNPRSAGCGDGYWLNRRFMFMGRWIKGCGYYPSYNVRLFKHTVGRYERIGALGDTRSGDNEVHEHVVLATGPAGYLKNDFLHFAYPDLHTWIEKHNRYSNWEAHAMAAENKGLLPASPFGGPIGRRRWLKQTAHRLPFRPTLRFIYGYFLKHGFRDGYPGYVLSRLMGWYEFISIAKHQEMRRQGRNRHSRRST